MCNQSAQRPWYWIEFLFSHNQKSLLRMKIIARNQRHKECMFSPTFIMGCHTRYRILLWILTYASTIKKYITGYQLPWLFREPPRMLGPFFLNDRYEWKIKGRLSKDPIIKLSNVSSLVHSQNHIADSLIQIRPQKHPFMWLQLNIHTQTK